MTLNFPAHHRPPHAVAQLVAGWHGVPLDTLASGETKITVAVARQELVQILTEFTPLGLADIGVVLNRPPTAIAYLLRLAKAAEQSNDATRLRMAALRNAVMEIPAEFGVPRTASANDVARAAIGHQVPGAFERLAIANIAAVEVLRDPSLSAEDARHAAFCLLTRPTVAPVVTADIIPMEGRTQ